MSWRRVAKSLQALTAHSLLLSFTLLLVLKLHHTISYSWWSVLFLSICVYVCISLYLFFLIFFLWVFMGLYLSDNTWDVNRMVFLVLCLWGFRFGSNGMGFEGFIWGTELGIFDNSWVYLFLSLLIFSL